MADPGDAAQWQTWAKEADWLVIVPGQPAGNAGIDGRVQAIEKAVGEAIQGGTADASRIYLVGRGDAAAVVFYAISRVPDLWAAAAALGGSPQPAIDSDRLYAANFRNVPLLWVTAGQQEDPLAGKLKAAEIPVEWRAGDKTSIGAIFEWLHGNKRDEYPASIDCETSSPSFARCYWIRMTKFDAAERNDVLPSSHLEPNNIASLDLGGFGYKTDDPGPGILVTYLPEKYNGPLKMGDRIVSLDGRAIANAAEYTAMMSQVKEEKKAAVMVQRGKDRTRIETAIVLPRRQPVGTARVQGNYLPEDKEIQIVSRTLTEMRVTIPPQWAPATLYWNGVALEKIEAPGCRLLTMARELQSSGPCP